jgi:hypothetical protein
VAGVATDVTGYNIQAELRDSSGALVLTFVVTKAVQSGATIGMFTLKTATAVPVPPLPVDMLVADIEFTLIADNTVRSSESFYLPVEAQVTT